MSTIKRSLLVLSLGVLLLPTRIKPLTVPRKTMIRGGVISTAAAFAAYATYAHLTKKHKQEVRKRNAIWTVVDYLKNNHEKKVEKWREILNLPKKRK